MKQLLFILLLVLSGKGYTQSKIDSLEQTLQFEKIDSLKIKTQLALAEAYRYENLLKADEYVEAAILLASTIKDKRYQVMTFNTRADLLNDRASYDSAIIFFQEALKLAEKIKFNNGKGAALVGLGNAFMRKGNLQEGEEYLKLNIAFAREIEDFESLASSYNNLGNVFNEQGEYKKAMQSYTKAVSINTRIGNEKNAGINMANIGLIHQKLENYEEAVIYFKKSEKIFKELDFLPGQAFVLKNTGIVFRNQGKSEEALIQYQKALANYSKMGRKREMAQVYQNIGNIFSDKKQLNEAIENYRFSLDIAKDINDSINIAMASQSLGLEFFYMNNLDSSETYSTNAIAIAENIGSHLTAMDGYKTLSEVNYAKENFKRAYELRTQYERKRDSLYNVQKRDLAEEIEAKYQNEQKTREIDLLASEKEVQTLLLSQRKNERNVLVAFTILITLLVVLLYNRNRIKQRSNLELKQLSQLKSNFFANISHEFRTPLTLIQGPIEYLEQNPNEKLSKNEIKMIRRNTNRVLGLVNQLLDLSRLDEGKLALKLTEGDIFKYLRAATASFYSHATQRDMDYRVNIPPEILWLAFDQDKLEKIVYNLISNAFKFSEDGELVTFDASYTGEELCIQVSDTGLGITEDKLPYIFDRFYQVDSGATKNQEGTGIGLSLSKDLVELMDGTITVSSEEGKGTYFTVQIPLKKIGKPHNPSNTILPNKTKARGNIKAFEFPTTDIREVPKILVIEDHEEMRKFIKSRLIDKYRVIEAKDGGQGLKVATYDMPDLIISDLMMPKMDGLELCRKLKTNLKTSHIPIILLTARAGEENKIEGLETGADDYLTKPFNAQELLARTTNLIDQRQRMRQYYIENQYTVDPEKLTTTSLDKKFLEQVLEILNKNHTNANFGVSQMQKELAMSKTQLNRKLKALTQESPRDLLRNFRLKQAAQLLAQKANTVTQIAYQVGFNNLSYFAKCFKERYGIPPSDY